MDDLDGCLGLAIGLPIFIIFFGGLILVPFSIIMNGEFQENAVGVTVVIIIDILIIWWIYSSAKEGKKKAEALANRNLSRKQQFLPKTHDPLPIDDKNQLFKIDNKRQEIFSFSELIDFKLYQDNNTITSGQRGAALNVGGVLLGGTLSTTSSAEVEKIDIVVNMIGRNPGRYTIKILKRPVRQNSEDYRLAIEKAEKTVKILNRILEYRDGNTLSDLNENRLDNLKEEKILVEPPLYQNNDTMLNVAMKGTKDSTNSNTGDSLETDNIKEIEHVSSEKLITLEGTLLQALTSTTYMFESQNGHNFIVESELDLAILLGARIRFTGIFMNESEIGSESIGVVKLKKLEKLI